VIINGMPAENRYTSNAPWKVTGRILREVFDALLFIVILISIAFLVYYLQIPQEERPAISDLIPWGTKTPGLTAMVTPTRTFIAITSPARTQTSTATFAPTATSAPIASPTPGLVSRATLTQASTVPLTVNQEIEAGMEQGNQIVEAVEAYLRARGFYPATLADLVPDYLSALPVTITSQSFFYRVFERTTVMSPEIYWISFRVVSQSSVTCTYHRRIQYWDCNFASP
jgi:hypothetical protein